MTSHCRHCESFSPMSRADMAILRASEPSMRPASSRKATRRPASNANTAAPSGKRTTAWSACLWATPRRSSTACSTARSTCPRKRGTRTVPAVVRRGFPTTWSIEEPRRVPVPALHIPEPLPQEGVAGNTARDIRIGISYLALVHYLHLRRPLRRFAHNSGNRHSVPANPIAPPAGFQ